MFIALVLSYFHSELPLTASAGCIMCSNSKFLRVSNAIHDGKIIGSAAAFDRRSQAVISMRVDERGKNILQIQGSLNVKTREVAIK